MYLSIAIGSIFSTIIMNKIGDVRCMAIGSMFNAPWILSLALGGLRADLEAGTPTPFYLSEYFITPVILFLSILNGVG